MQGFKQFFYLSEAVNWGFFGTLKSYAGNNESERLNYGTAKEFGGNPMLYVPLDRSGGEIGSVLTAARRMLSRTGVDCVPDAGAFGGWRCGPSGEPHAANFHHTGESHVTVAYGNELEPFFQKMSSGDINLSRRVELISGVHLATGGKLFESGQGCECPVHAVTGGKALIYGLAKLFDDVPIVVLLKVECPMVLTVRQALGLPPPASGYVSHITVAYAFPYKADKFMSTNPKNKLPLPASARHNRTYLSKQGLPEWFEPLGYLSLRG